MTSLRQALRKTLERALGRLAPPGEALARATLAAGEGPVFVAVMGIARFGELRRHFGSAMADRILNALSARITEHLPAALVGRVGRTTIELALRATDAEAAQGVLAGLQDALEAPLELDGQGFDLTIAIGFAEAQSQLTEAAVEQAELALASAQAGHQKLARYSERDRAEAEDRLALLRDLRQGLALDETFLCYQPKLNARTGTVDSAEALIRWRHPVRGMVPPDAFIGLAEETGLIGDLTRRVVLRTIKDQARLKAAGYDIHIDVNISARLLADPAFAAWALATVKAAQGRIGFEITETAVIGDPEVALAHLNAFAAAGIRIAIDDYGSGLSSLAYLKQLPAHELKIDRMFVSGLTTSHRDPLLVRSTIDLAHALDMKVTAEGVDNMAALALLKVMGCDMIQGYVISYPLEFADLKAFLVRGQSFEMQTPGIPGLSRTG